MAEEQQIWQPLEAVAVAAELTVLAAVEAEPTELFLEQVATVPQELRL